MRILTLAVVLGAFHSPAAAPACVQDPGRSGYAMAYDAGRQRAVIFGGESPDGTLTSDLLAWDGAGWACLTSGGPAPRSDASLAYDARRKVLVLYGGRAGRTSFRDTWELSGSTWTLRDTAGPTPEPHGVAAFDSTSGVVLLFAGLGDDTPARRTWSWNGAAWTPAGEEPRGQFPNAMLDGAAGARVRLMTAVRIGSDRYNPVLFERTSGGWREFSAGGDLPVFSPQAPGATMPNGAVLYAGFEADQRVGTWTLEGARWTRYAGASPSRRKGAQMTYDALRKVAVLHAGDDGNRVLSDTWEWDGRAWKQIR
jgi:hypothetical protein